MTEQELQIVHPFVEIDNDLDIALHRTWWDWLTSKVEWLFWSDNIVK